MKTHITHKTKHQGVFKIRTFCGKPMEGLEIVKHVKDVSCDICKWGYYRLMKESAYPVSLEELHDNY